MPEYRATPEPDIQSNVLQAPSTWIGLREVRIHYGLTSLTISVVEVDHHPVTGQQLADLILIRQIPLAEFMSDPHGILRVYVDTLLAPVWRLSEGNSGGA